MFWASQVAQWLRIRPPIQKTQETWVQSLGWEDPLEKKMATHSSILSWEIPWTEVPGRLQSMGSQRVGHNLTTKQQLTYSTTRSKRSVLRESLVNFVNLTQLFYFCLHIFPHMISYEVRRLPQVQDCTVSLSNILNSVCQAVEVLQRQAFLKHNSYLKAETDVRKIMNRVQLIFIMIREIKEGRESFIRNLSK